MKTWREAGILKLGYEGMELGDIEKVKSIEQS